MSVNIPTPTATGAANTVAYVERYAGLLVSAAAAAVAAIDPTTLPPKFAAGVIIAAQVLATAERVLVTIGTPAQSESLPIVPKA